MIPGLNILAKYLYHGIIIMKFEFEHIEKELAMEAWIMYAFKIYDKILEEDLDFGRWLKADLRLFEMN